MFYALFLSWSYTFTQFSVGQLIMHFHAPHEISQLSCHLEEFPFKLNLSSSFRLEFKRDVRELKLDQPFVNLRLAIWWLATINLLYRPIIINIVFFLGCKHRCYWAKIHVSFFFFGCKPIKAINWSYACSPNNNFKFSTWQKGAACAKPNQMHVSFKQWKKNLEIAIKATIWAIFIILFKLSTIL